MLKRLSFGIVVVLALSLLFSACSTMKDYQEKDDFNEKTEDFAMRMLWQDFVGVSLHFDEDLREAFLERFEDWDTFKVTEMKLSRATSELDGEVERKTVHYKLEYYLLTDMVVRKEKINLVWELSPEIDEQQTFWRIVEPFPELEAEKKKER